MATFTNDVSACTQANILSGAAAIASCIEGRDGTSNNCSLCFGTYGVCGAMHCLSQCTGSGGSTAPECQSCLATNCGAALTNCTGISADAGL